MKHPAAAAERASASRLMARPFQAQRRMMPGEFISPEQIKKRRGPRKMEHFLGRGQKWKKCTCKEYHPEGSAQG